MTVLHGRHVAPLIVIWCVGLGISALLFWLQHVMPALVDIMTPLYFVIGGILLVVTGKWFRDRHHERRRADRRHVDRRDFR